LRNKIEPLSTNQLHKASQMLLTRLKVAASVILQRTRQHQDSHKFSSQVRRLKKPKC
jgi:hypothetical protein